MLEKSCEMMALEDMANLILPDPESKKRRRGEATGGGRETRSVARKLREREALGLNAVDGGLCRGKVFNEIIMRGVLPSGDVVYLVSYIVGTKNIEKRWEYAQRGNLVLLFEVEIA